MNVDLHEDRNKKMRQKRRRKRKERKRKEYKETIKLNIRSTYTRKIQKVYESESVRISLQKPNKMTKRISSQIPIAIEYVFAIQLDISHISLIGTWLVIALVACAHNEFEWQNDCNQGPSLV